ncbi:MAG: crossover junction endodeoxyribonuclease RuvC [Chitinivibrionia bacterium]|nr:crossover junction endodeoxyribonuclease RuvC [Chitinivibrionia bacterium]
MYTILGVDPGSSCTGYGIVSGEGDAVAYVDSGIISLRGSMEKHEKLKTIFLEIDRLLELHTPTHVSIEHVFYGKNPKSMLVLGEARGAAILAAALRGVPVFEYSAREVKQAVTGNGAADKSQVQFMLGRILKLEKPIAIMDESDAVAIALCHAFRNREWSRV